MGSRNKNVSEYIDRFKQEEHDSLMRIFSRVNNKIKENRVIYYNNHKFARESKDKKEKEKVKGLLLEAEKYKMIAQEAEDKFVAEMEDLDLRYYRLTGRRLDFPSTGWKMPTRP